MLKLYDNGIYLVNGETICSCPEEVAQKTGRIVDAKEAERHYGLRYPAGPQQER